MNSTRRLAIETLGLVLGFAAIGVIMSLGSMKPAQFIPLLLIFAAGAWTPLWVSWRRRRADPRSTDAARH